MATFQESRPAEGEELLEAVVELGFGQLELQAGSPGLIYDLDLHYNESLFSPRVEYERVAGRGRLRIGLSGAGESLRRFGKTRFNVCLDPETPLELDTRTGVGDSQIDLSGLRVRALRLENGVGETRLSMLHPNPDRCERLSLRSGVGALEVIGLGNFAFRDFRFQGGVGSTTLDLSGSWEVVGEMEIEVGVGSVEILIPRNIGAEVQVSRSVLSNVDLREFRRQGDVYYSENLDRAEKVIRLRVRAGIGKVTVGWI